MTLIETLPPAPLTQLDSWLTEAKTRGVKDYNAVALATVSPAGQPSVRIVLCKGVEADAVVFFTNYESRKAEDLESNPRAALAFHWSEYGRQVRLEGTTEKTTRAASEEYFASRPRGSQLGAWASKQSQALGSFADLTAALAAVTRKFEGKTVPCPPNWGGFRFVPDVCEFWLSAESRLHDRVLYRRERGAWIKTQVAP